MPELDAPRFLAQLGKKAPRGVVLLGEDAYLRDACRKGVIEAHVPEATREWAVARFSLREQDLDAILQQAQTMPMLASCQVLIVSELERVEKLGDEARDAAVAALGAYLDDPAPFTILVLEATKLDERMKLTKMLYEKAAVVRVDLDDQDVNQKIELATTLTKKMAAEAGVTIDAEAAAQLADCLDGALGQIQGEIEKLASYVGAAKRIRTADVEAVVFAAKKYSVWQLADILATGQRSKALVFLDSVLREGEEPAQIVGALAWMYRALLIAQELPANVNKFQAAGKMRMRPDAAEQAIRQSRAIPRAKLLAGIEALADADSTIKSGFGSSTRAVMEILIANLTRASASSASARR
jgi:DNA polymerase III subunit delta